MEQITDGQDTNVRLMMLEAEVMKLTTEIKNLSARIPAKDTLTITEIAKYLGVAHSSLYKPWNMPNFGKPDIGSSPRRWLREKALRWYQRPEAERRAEWEAKSTSEKASYR